MSGPDPLAVLRAFVEAHVVPHPQWGQREPILCIRTAGGPLLKHHALDDSELDIDDALLEDIQREG